MGAKRSLGGLAAAALVAGCSGGASHGLSISAATRGASTSGGTTPAAASNSIDLTPDPTGGGSPSAGAGAVAAGNAVAVDRIRIVVRRVEVDGAGACATNAVAAGNTAAPVDLSPDVADSSPAAAGNAAPGSAPDVARLDGAPDTSADCEVAGGPYLVDLSGADLASGVHWIAGMAPPAGTYDEVKFTIDTVDPATPGLDPGLTAMAAAHASILVDGTASGASFEFSTPMEVSQEREGTFVVGGATGTNLTLSIDPSRWFTGPDGGALDPADPTARGAIEANIRASIRLLHDDDEDGVEDASGAAGTPAGASPDASTPEGAPGSGG